MTSKIVAADPVLFLTSVLSELACAAAMTAAYPKWSDEFSRKEIREVWADEVAPMRRQRNECVTLEQLRGLSRETLYSLGFRNWDDRLINIPLWAVNYIEDGEVECINGKMCKLSETDRDQRGGCIAYGFAKPKTV